MALVNQADLEARLGRSLTSEESTAFSTINSANQKFVEELIGSSLETASATNRLYDGGKQNLAIDPCTEIASIKRIDEYGNVDDTYATSDYTTEPVNKTLKQWVRHRYGRFSNGFNNIQVNAKFSIAGDTEMQTLVKDILLDVLEAQVTDARYKTKESIEGYSVEYSDTDTKAALNKLGTLFQIAI